MPRDWHELDEDELRELEEVEDEVPRGWRPGQGTIRAIEDVGEAFPPVKGFEISDVLSNEDVAEYLSTELPEKHVKRIEEIKYTDKYIGDENGYIAGMYIPGEHGVSKIEINRQSPEGSHDAEEMKRTIAHEVGHNVYYNLSEEQRDEWGKISANSAPHEFVSDYARTRFPHFNIAKRGILWYPSGGRTFSKLMLREGSQWRKPHITPKGWIILALWLASAMRLTWWRS